MKRFSLILFPILILIYGCRKELNDNNETESFKIIRSDVISESVFTQAFIKDFYFLGLNGNTIYFKTCFWEDSYIHEINVSNIDNITDFQVSYSGFFVLCNNGSKLLFYKRDGSNGSYMLNWEMNPTDSILNFGNYIIPSDYYNQEIILGCTNISLRSTIDHEIKTVSLLKVDEYKNATKLTEFQSFTEEQCSNYSFVGYYSIKPISINDGFGILSKQKINEPFSCQSLYFMKFNSSFEFNWTSSFITCASYWSNVYITKTGQYLILTETKRQEPADYNHFIVSFVSNDGYINHEMNFNSDAIIGVYGALYNNVTNKLEILSIYESSPELYSIDLFDHFGDKEGSKMFKSEFIILKNTFYYFNKKYYVIGIKEQKTYLIEFGL